MLETQKKEERSLRNRLVHEKEAKPADKAIQPLGDAVKIIEGSKPKKLLFIEANLDGTIGGSHLLLLDLIKFLDRKKFDPYVVFFQENTLIPEFKAICPVFVFNKMNRLNIRKRFPSMISRTRLLFGAMILFQKMFNIMVYFIPDLVKTIWFLWKNHIDLVHMNNAPYLPDWLIICKLLGIKCIAHLRGNWVAKPLSRRLVRHYDAVISMSNSVTNFMRGQGVETKNFVVIYDGIDIGAVKEIRERNGEQSSKKKGSDQQVVLGVVGNIKPWKGQHVLIEAIGLLKPSFPSVKCLIVGDVSNLKEDQAYFERLNELVRQYGLEKNVVFTGFRKDVYDVVSGFEILVHTSVEPEPFGRVILEGMILRKPVIATAHGGPLEIIDDNINGYLVAPNSPERLAERIEYLIRNPDIREKIGEQAKKRVEESFDMKKNVKEIELLYRRLLNFGRSEILGNSGAR